MIRDSSHISGANRLIGHASIYAAGNIMRQLAGFLMLPIYTRFLTPADYGIVGLMTIAISLIELLFGVRLILAIPKYYFENKDEIARGRVVSTAIFITGTISAIATVGLVLFQEPASRLIFGTSAHSFIVAFFAVQILTLALEDYGLVYLRIQQKPWLYVGINMLKLLLQLSLNIWLVVFLEMGVLGIAISGMGSSSIFSLLLMSYTLRKVGFRFDLRLAEKMVRFCWPLWIGGLAGLYIGSANRYFLRLFSSLDDIGIFELAVKFSTIISILVWDPFAQFWQVERFRYYQRGNAETVFQNVFHFISTFLVLAALGVAIFAEPVIRIMADEAFYNAALSVPFLAFSSVFSSLIAFSNFSFLVTEKTGWISRNNYLTAIIITVFYFVMIPLGGHIGAAVAFMLAQAVQFLIVHHSARRFYDMGIPLKNFLIILMISAIACWISHVLHREKLIEDIAIKIAVFISAGVLIFIPIWKNTPTRVLLTDLLSDVLKNFKARLKIQRVV